MKFNLFSIFVILLLFTFCTPSKKSPNFILIMADDLGYGDIGCFGSNIINTPVLDKMAAEGMKFTDYHSNGSVCTPTRAALMTGNYQQRAGLEGVIYAALDKRKEGIAASEKTIAEYFKEAGYATGIFGKWHLGYKPKYNPTYHGFDEFYGYVSGNVDFISHRDGAGLYDWWQNRDTSYEKGYVTDLITDHALDFMEENRDNPFLIYIPHEAPHYPYQGRNDPAIRVPGEKAPFQSDDDKRRAYKEMVEVMDENVGRVFQKLKDLDLEENTYVIFCSDNGATKLGDNGELNGFKGSLWEGGHRVPAIAWNLNNIKAGSETNSTVLSMDWLPTFLSLAGISFENSFDGVDVSPILNGKNKPERKAVFWRYRNQWSVREGDWKYLKIKKKEYLFNLKNDLGEENSLINLEKEKAEEMRLLLDKWENEMSNYILQTN